MLKGDHHDFCSNYDDGVCVLSCVQLSAAPWTVAHQAPLSVEFSKQEYWSGLLFPSPGDLPDPGIKPTAPAIQADSLLLSHQGSQLQLGSTYLNVILIQKKPPAQEHPE